MKKVLWASITGVGLVAASLVVVRTKAVAAQPQEASLIVYDSQGRLKLPDPAVFRKWVFLGAPTTPNGLNNGKANFPEFHHVYVEQKNFDEYIRTGTFPEGTMLVKELDRLLNPTFPDGSRKEPSGRGFFNGAFNGIDLSIKDSKKYSKTNGWGYFTFGHHPLPYDEWASEASPTECAGCHITYVAKTDMTWLQFYPILNQKNPSK
jgi:hypothetical protein